MCGGERHAAKRCAAVCGAARPHLAADARLPVSVGGSLRFADLGEAVYCPECDEREFGGRNRLVELNVRDRGLSRLVKNHKRRVIPSDPRIRESLL
jgi:hypothetical protein